MAFLRQTFRHHVRVPRGEPAPEVAVAVAALTGMMIGDDEVLRLKLNELIAALKGAGLMLDA